ncbi:hypothetical protein IM787_05760 [Ramlibacter sp. HM2]|uniref:Methyl-accepting chemotaxis protein n=2 Tax=Ramlibacter pallidus TaxID=2780087 RepID=A0ABR9S0M4_9BURK|nr:hypothetical protein [Ramlibacter pallidus]
MLALFASAFVVVAALAVWLRLSVREGILRSLRAASNFIDKVAAGDLTARVDARGSGGMQKMLEGLDRMGGDLRALVGEVQAVARRVTDFSAQISHGNLDLSQRTEEQATTLEETASSMEELTSTVASNADNAREASRLAAGASRVAHKGGEAVEQVVSTMAGISAASRRIEDIIGVIDGIAFQTNILALNAAVEAARAGDQGRGFAVVAGEVRALAQRSATAAREIRALIAESTGRVEAGARLVQGAGETMREIVVSVEKVSGLVAEIAQACQEQSAGIGQVNGAITQMEQVVQQNASLVEEAAAATESMKDDAAMLFRLVSRFRLEDAFEAVAAPARDAGPAGAAPTNGPAVVALGVSRPLPKLS